MSIKFGESFIRNALANFKFGDHERFRKILHRAIVYEITLAGFKFGDFPQNRQFAKLKTLLKFPAVWYYVTVCSNLSFLHRLRCIS